MRSQPSTREQLLLLEPHPRAYPLYKRPLDVVLGALLLIVATPFLAVVSLIVKLSSPGPILFRQERIGMNRRPFIIYKFRTMYHGVDSSLHREYFLKYKDGIPVEGEDGTAFKMHSDPRITPFGKVLRRLGLDELPQLFNVVKGDMSIVGPRPPLDYEVEWYTERHLRRLEVKPGLTGFWQIRGRDVVDFETMVDMDIQYIDRQSLLLDIGIILLTPPVVLLAYVGGHLPFFRGRLAR